MRRPDTDLEEKREPRGASSAGAREDDSMYSSGRSLTLAAIEKRPSRSARKLARLGGFETSRQAPGPLATTVKLGRASGAPVLCATLNAATGLLRPFSSTFPRSSSLTIASTARATRLLIRICPSFASSHNREARLHTVPIAV